MRVLLAVLGALASPVARADPEPAPAPYRSMMIVMDAGALAFVAGGGALAYRARSCDCEDFSGELAVAGLMMYVAWGAFAHHDAGHDGRAVASVVLRAGLPLAAGLLAHDLGAGPGITALSAGGAMLGALALDWFALADPTQPGRPVAPYAAPTQGGAIVGIAGRFR